MPEKSVPLSVRISVDDAEFIARLSLEGATTPSEKMRKLLGEARRRREDAADYGRCLGMVRESSIPRFARCVSSSMQRGCTRSSR